MRIVADIESNGLLDTITKIHCFCYQEELSGSSGSITDYGELKKFLSQPELTIIGHNFARFDKPALKKILGVDFKFKVIDTLPLSWTLYTQYLPTEHSLDDWGDRLGIKKPEISDWSNLTVEEYVHRCSEDVKINVKLWNKQYAYLKALYKDDKEIDRYCAYLSFKMDCMREQEEIGVALNVPHVEEMAKKLAADKEVKTAQLMQSMPANPIKKKKVYENAVLDKNGNLFVKGDLFYSSVRENQMAKEITLEKIKGYEEANPNSNPQIKSWLYSLGWVPAHIKHVRNKETGEVKKIPQISSKFIPGEVCESVKLLFEKEPKLELLNGLSVLSHRIGIFEGFLEDNVNGRIYPTCVGLTNTLRLQHRIVVNLPGFDKKYGNEIRGSLIADEGHILCGSDLSGIEDNTKRHYIYKYDPSYVNEMSVEGFDPHLDIAVLAGFLTKEQAEEHKLYDKTKGKEGKSYKSIRHKAKTTNFSATYKVGVPSLARNAGITEKEAKTLLDIYWKRNGAILKVEKSLEVKMVNGQKWLKNPVSGFWYTLRAEKDRFSTLNQSSAVFVFDTWLKYIRHMGIKVAFQMHDEMAFNLLDGKEEETKSIINKAIDKVNEELKLNVQIRCSIDFGKDYSKIH